MLIIYECVEHVLTLVQHLGLLDGILRLHDVILQDLRLVLGFGLNCL